MSRPDAPDERPLPIARRVTPARSTERSRPRKPRVSLVKVLVGVFALVILVCGGLAALVFWWAGAFGPRWQKFDHPAVGVAVDMPGTTWVRGSPNGVTDHSTYVALRLVPPNEYSLCVMKPGMFSDPSAAADWGIGNTASLRGGTVQSKSNVEGQEFPTVDGSFLLANGDTVVVRAVAVGSRLAVLTVEGHDLRLEDRAVRHYFDSFIVTDPALRNEHAAVVAARLAECEQVARARAAQQQQHLMFQAEVRAKIDAIAKDYSAFELGGIIPTSADPASLPGLKAHLRFNAPEDVVEPPAGFIGIVPLRTGRGVHGTALHLLPKSRAYIGDGEAFAIPRDQEWTLAVWVRMREPTGHVFAIRQGKKYVGGEWQMMRTSLFVNDGTMLVHISQPVGPDGRYVNGTEKKYEESVSAPWPKDQAWHHFAATRKFLKAGGEQLDFYVDGRKVHSQNRNTRTDLSSIDQIKLGDGTGHELHPGQFQFVGAVDDLCWYDRVLAAAELQQLAGVTAEK